MQFFRALSSFVNELQIQTRKCSGFHSARIPFCSFQCLFPSFDYPAAIWTDSPSPLGRDLHSLIQICRSSWINRRIEFSWIVDKSTQQSCQASKKELVGTLAINSISATCGSAEFLYNTPLKQQSGLGQQRDMLLLIFIHVWWQKKLWKSRNIHKLRDCRW